MQLIAALTGSVGMLAGGTAPVDAAPRGWVGGYVYEQALGRDIAGETALTVTHRLTLGRHSCLIVAEGYQTADRIRCETRARSRGIEVRFLRYEEAAGPAPRKRPYRVHDPLFTLGREPEGLVTYWKSYAAAPEGPRRGRFFRPG